MARLAVVASQLLLIAGFVWFAAVWREGPNGEQISVNLVALALAGTLAFVLLLWARGIRVPLVAANAILAVPFAFSLFALGSRLDWGSTLAALGLVATIVGAIAGFTSAPSGQNPRA